MNAKTMEGLAGAGTNMNLLNTPMRVYKEAERRGDLSMMERAADYAGRFASKAHEYQKKAEEGMKEEAEEFKEKVRLDQEKAKEAREKAILAATAECVFDLLEEYGPLSDELRNVILGQQELQTLKNWQKLAARAGSVEEFVQRAGLQPQHG